MAKLDGSLEGFLAGRRGRDAARSLRTTGTGQAIAGRRNEHRSGPSRKARAPGRGGTDAGAGHGRLPSRFGNLPSDCT